MSFNARILSRIYLSSCRPCYSTAASTDLRTRLQHEIKTAMKNRDTTTSMTLRSVMSEILLAEKTSKDGAPTESAMASIIRKAVQRRTEAVAKFKDASRPDLAEKEQKEADLLSAFLPPLLSTTQIDDELKAVIKNLPAGGGDLKKHLGAVFKEFYAKVDKSTVDPNVVKHRAQELLATQSS
ncbi:hypothetical protein D9613_000575 [Agrocybe pediades]|uniref:Altered inheritance of mitochondria protein 41 n=1 Tax=Agrocybe pediades TaxID=84607 RepID=A0A8H4R1F9_9AGAR|nr:hypothetical protein D9613_000575 [Agrocybe pediades]